MTNGLSFWRKTKNPGTGLYPDITLAQARERREEARKLLANGGDPSAIKRTTKQAQQKTLQVSEHSFRNLALELHKVKSPMWTAGHAKQWLVSMEKYAMPVIGDRPISGIEPMEIVGIMRTVEKTSAWHLWQLYGPCHIDSKSIIMCNTGTSETINGRWKAQLLLPYCYGQIMFELFPTSGCFNCQASGAI